MNAVNAVSLLPALVLCASAPLLVPAQAAARGDVLQVSADGRHWSSALRRPLFDPQVRWVPGDVRTARFWVRNRAAETGALRVQVIRDGRVALIDADALVVSARAGAEPWRRIAAGTTTTAYTGLRVASDRAVPVQLRVVMPYAAPNPTMLLATDLDLRIELTDADLTGPTASGALPSTGSDVAWWTGLLGVVLGACGLTLVRRRSTRTEEAA